MIEYLMSNGWLTNIDEAGDERWQQQHLMENIKKIPRNH